MKTVAVVTKDLVLTSIIERTLKDYNTIFFPNIKPALDFIYNSVPDMLVLDTNVDDPNAVRMLNDLKSDPIFGQLPVLLVLAEDFVIPHWENLIVEDYVKRKDVEDDLLLRLGLCLFRSERVVEVNPLTRLPGNIAISRQIQARIDRKEQFGLAYADLDYFKPFNDKYGFSRGDEVIKMVGRLVLNMVKGRQPSGSFIGHIGGDDFTFIMDTDLIEDTSRDIIENFDRIIPTFYDHEDRIIGCIDSFDRDGHKKTFPLIGISIGVVHNETAKFTHYGEITEIASEMKKYAKSAHGSCYKLDRRQYASTKS